MNKPKNKFSLEIVILGLGRFGCLWSNYMSQLGRVQGYDSNPLAAPAFKQDEFDKSSAFIPLSDQESLFQAIEGCDVLFFCVPISALQKTLAELRPCLAAIANNHSRPKNRPLWLMDTCSVKMQPMAWLNQAIDDLDQTNFRILGLHPMFGPDSASNSIVGLPLVLCPQNLIKQELQFWQQCFATLGLRNVVLSPDEHDREAARTQGLTHLLGRILEALDLQQSPIATAGYQALCQLRTQTCHDTWQLFLDLQWQNSYTPTMRCELQQAIDNVYNALKRK